MTINFFDPLYCQKFQNYPSGVQRDRAHVCYQEYGKHQVKKYRKTLNITGKRFAGFEDEDLIYPKGRNPEGEIVELPNFWEFIRSVLDATAKDLGWGLREMMPDWTPAFFMCDYCERRFDVILKAENLEREWKMFWENVESLSDKENRFVTRNTHINTYYSRPRLIEPSRDRPILALISGVLYLLSGGLI